MPSPTLTRVPTSSAEELFDENDIPSPPLARVPTELLSYMFTYVLHQHVFLINGSLKNDVLSIW
jgi:hypothetical protein